jgi:UPF0755 protein
MKKLFLGLGLLGVITAAVVYYALYGNKAYFVEKEKYIVIKEDGLNSNAIGEILHDNQAIASVWWFKQLANQMNVWEKVKPGKYKISRQQNALSIARMLRNNQQAKINLVINKLRKPQDFAKIITKQFDIDSAEANTIIDDFLKNNNLGITIDNWLTQIVPNTYNFYWNTPIEKIFSSLQNESAKFWNNERKQKLQAIGVSQEQAIIIASIVEEETNLQSDKGKIASVYINRLNKNMALGADPTIKFALNDFSLRRILNVHLQVPSPYNTYKNKGLPPGPICTPSIKTIDAVLEAPRTDYLFFVADASLDGTHHFSVTDVEHVKYAKLYQKAVAEYLAKKQNP